MNVELVDKMGSDLSVVNAARVSYAKTKDLFDAKDEKLIKFLETVKSNIDTQTKAFNELSRIMKTEVRTRPTFNDVLEQLKIKANDMTEVADKNFNKTGHKKKSDRSIGS